MRELPSNPRFPTFSDMGYCRSPTSGRGIIAAYWKGPGMQVVPPTTATKPILEGSRVIVWPDRSAGCSTTDLPGKNWRERVPRTSEDVCGYNDAARSFTLPYRRSVGAGVSELRFERRFGPEAFPSFEDFVASQPLGVYRSTNHKKSMHSVQQNVHLHCCEGLPSPFGKTCVKYKFVRPKICKINSGANQPGVCVARRPRRPRICATSASRSVACFIGLCSLLRCTPRRKKPSCRPQRH